MADEGQKVDARGVCDGALTSDPALLYGPKRFESIDWKIVGWRNHGHTRCRGPELDRHGDARIQ